VFLEPAFWNKARRELFFERGSVLSALGKIPGRYKKSFGIRSIFSQGVL
jgi:hypothetical protein